MTSLERLAIEIAAGLLLIWGTVAYLEHRGAAACRQADTIAAAKQEAHNAAQAADDTKSINLETKAYHDALAAAPDPTPALVCVRKYAAPAAVPQAAATRSVPDGPADLPKTDRGGFDPGPRLTPIGQEADARVTELQAYIRDVCLAP